MILTGAPGTGKTHLANEIAKEMIKGQIAEEAEGGSSDYELIPIMEVDWKTYYKLVQSENNYNTLTERLKVISKIKSLFNSGKHFKEFSDNERKYIAGTLGKNQSKQFDEDSWWFGHMGGNGLFAGAINSNNEKLSDALDNIPIKGSITKQNYDSFVENFNNAVKGNNVGCASRLLAMKRPDFFVCINGKNKNGLKEDFDDRNIDKSFDNYWDFILQVHESEWYKDQNPKTGIEKDVEDARVALLDSYYYEESYNDTLDDYEESDKNVNIEQNKLDKNLNIDSVQFHPSYDYTDFVEGLRPKKVAGENEIGFELKNGVFKDFCKKAKNNPNEKYIFIIDEINRGEISKIFGELFFSIEPSYRGLKGKIQTQYTNIQSAETETIFDENLGKGWFYVPKNVYIIGTMNDIDRSVESFDFAMRRRFTWKEITAEQSAENMKLSKEIKDKMTRLNAEISKINGLNDSYHIGGAYFLDKDDNPRTDYDAIWELRLEPLLREYLRGTQNAKDDLKKLENAYNLKEDSK